MSGDDLGRTDIQAALEARRDLGQEYDQALVDSFAERIEKAVDRRVAQEMTQSGTRATPAPSQLPIVPNALAIERERAARATSTRQFALGIVSCVAGIPISAITAATADGSAAKLAIAWVGLVGVNLAHAVAARRNG